MKEEKFKISSPKYQDFTIKMQRDPDAGPTEAGINYITNAAFDVEGPYTIDCRYPGRTCYKLSLDKTRRPGDIIQVMMKPIDPYGDLIGHWRSQDLVGIYSQGDLIDEWPAISDTLPSLVDPQSDGGYGEDCPMMKADAINGYPSVACHWDASDASYAGNTSLVCENLDGKAIQESPITIYAVVKVITGPYCAFAALTNEDFRWDTATWRSPYIAVGCSRGVYSAMTGNGYGARAQDYNVGTCDTRLYPAFPSEWCVVALRAPMLLTSTLMLVNNEAAPIRFGTKTGEYDGCVYSPPVGQRQADYENTYTGNTDFKLTVGLTHPFYYQPETGEDLSEMAELIVFKAHHTEDMMHNYSKDLAEKYGISVKG